MARAKLEKYFRTEKRDSVTGARHFETLLQQFETVVQHFVTLVQDF